MGVERWIDAQGSAVQDPSQLGSTSTKLGATSQSISGAPVTEVMLITALTVVPATTVEAGGWQGLTLVRFQLKLDLFCPTLNRNQLMNVSRSC